MIPCPRCFYSSQHCTACGGSGHGTLDDFERLIILAGQAMDALGDAFQWTPDPALGLPVEFQEWHEFASSTVSALRDALPASRDDVLPPDPETIETPF